MHKKKKGEELSYHTLLIIQTELRKKKDAFQIIAYLIQEHAQKRFYNK